MPKDFKAIGFDWSGVVFFHSLKYSDAGSHFLNIPKEEFFSSYIKYNHLLNIQEMNAMDFWQLVFDDLKRSSEVAGFLKFLDSHPIGNLNIEILPLIESLKKNGYKVGLLSNHTRAGARQAREFGVDKIFSVALFSAEIGFMKPDPVAFITLADQLGVNPSEMIFIDDSAKSLERSGEVGFEPVLYTDMESLKTKLKELGVAI